MSLPSGTKVVSAPQKTLSSDCHVSGRPAPNPRTGKPNCSRAVLPARRIKSAHEMDLPYFCLIGHSRRRALSRLALSGQLFSGAKRCWPYKWNIAVSTHSSFGNQDTVAAWELGVKSYHTTTATSIDGAVGTCTVPGQTNKQTTVRAEVCRPPRLRLRQRRLDV